MAKLILSAFADEYSSNFIEQLKALNGFGINYIEVRGVDGKNVSTLTASEVKDAKLKLNDYGIKVSSIGSPLGKIKLSDDLNAHYDLAKRVFETANELGTKNIRAFSFYMPDGKTADECESEVFDAVGKLIDIADGFGVTLCHENEAKIYGESPLKCKKLLDNFNGKLKAVFDMGNFVLDGFKPYPDAYKLLENHVEYFHIKDSLYAGAIVPPGKGEAQISEILNDYTKNGKKDTFITLEPHLQTFDGLNALAGKSFDNPYKYENAQIAFTDAVNKLKQLI